MIGYIISKYYIQNSLAGKDKPQEVIFSELSLFAVKKESYHMNSLHKHI